MIGDDQPLPGMSARQTMFVVPQAIGRLRTVACPWPSGPRNCGQSALRVVMRLNHKIDRQIDAECARPNMSAIVLPSRRTVNLPGAAKLSLPWPVPLLLLNSAIEWSAGLRLAATRLCPEIARKFPIINYTISAPDNSRSVFTNTSHAFVNSCPVLKSSCSVFADRSSVFAASSPVLTNSSADLMSSGSALFPACPEMKIQGSVLSSSPTDMKSHGSSFKALPSQITVEIYDLKRQKRHAVITLHGILRTI